MKILKLLVAMTAFCIFASGCSRKQASQAAPSLSPLSNSSTKYITGIPGANYAIPGPIGAVFWDGQYSNSANGDNLISGLGRLVQQGFQSYKIPLDTADAANNFNIQLNPTGSQTQSGPAMEQFEIHYLEQLATGTVTNMITNQQETSPYLRAFQNPGVSNVVLSTYDPFVSGLDYSQRNFANGAFLAGDYVSPQGAPGTGSIAQDIVQEYYYLSLALFRNFKNTGKKFILSTWETENSLYCGSAYSFIVTPSFRSNCLSNYQNSYGAADPWHAYQNIALWFSYRQQGVMQAQAQALAEGDTGVTVEDGIEISAVNMLNNINYPDTIHYMTQFFRASAYNYSSYESLNLGTLVPDVGTIHSLVGGAEVNISEWGYAQGQLETFDGTSYTADEMYTLTTKQILQLYAQGQINFATAWEAYESNGFGMLNNDGSNTSFFNDVMAGIEAAGPVALPPVTPVINPNGFVYSGIGYDGRATVSVWGLNFGDSGSSTGAPTAAVHMNCNNSPMPDLAVIYLGNGQINGAFTPLVNTESCYVIVTVNGVSSGISNLVQIQGTNSSRTTGPVSPVSSPIPAPTPSPTPAPSTAPAITAVTYGGVANNSTYINILGTNFQQAGNMVQYNCGSGWQMALADGPGGQNTTFVQASLPGPLGDSTCTFQVYANGQLSNVSSSLTLPGIGPTITSIVNGGTAGGNSYLNISGTNFQQDGNTAQYNCGAGWMPALSAGAGGQSATFLQISFPSAPAGSGLRSCQIQVIANGLTSNIYTATSVP